MDTVTMEVGAAPLVHIRQVAGDLRLTGRESTVLEAKASHRGEITATQSGEGVELSCQSACLIFLPGGARVEVDTVGGDARATGVAGGLTLGTIGGDLSARRIGAVKVEHVGGDLVVSRAAGEVSADWVGGDAKLEQVEGSVQVGSLGGELRAEGVCGSLTAAVGGDAGIELNPPAGSATRITADGDIDCRLDPKASLMLTLRAGGDLHAMMPGESQTDGDRLVVRLGEGQATAELEAGGDLWVRLGTTGVDRMGMGADLHGAVQAQVAAALAQVEAGLGALGAGSYGFDAERMSARIRRAAERAQRRAERVRERGDSHASRHPWHRRHTWLAGLDLGAGAPTKVASDEERLTVLRMLEQGTITVQEAEKLLNALEGHS